MRTNKEKHRSGPLLCWENNNNIVQTLIIEIKIKKMEGLLESDCSTDLAKV